MNGPTAYVGRFAPSPTGPLHYGSLLTATASYLDARAADGRWHLRIDNIDPPREQAGAADEILRALEACGFDWDGPVVYQAASGELHRDALERLAAAGLTYRCRCSRTDLADAPRGPLGIVYPGTCRTRTAPIDAGEYAIRVLTTDEPVGFDDLLQGRCEQRLQSEGGDFIVWRRDGLVAYHLACVVDDAALRVSHVIRGIDLMESTPRQILLQGQLDLPQPAYGHLPVAVNAAGDKLSKLTGARPIPLERPGTLLLGVLRDLGIELPADADLARPASLLAAAVPRWRREAVLGRKQLSVPAGTS